MKKIIFSILIVMLFFYGCVEEPDGNDNGNNGGYNPPSEKTDEQLFMQKLKSEGIDATDVEINENQITVTYNELSSKGMEELYATMTFIFASGIEYLDSSDGTVTAVVNFDDGESLQATAEAGDIMDFLNEEISTSAFIYSWDIEFLTQGPQIPE